jgi:hypothetical protein
MSTWRCGWTCPRSYFFVGQRSALLMLASLVRSALFRTVDTRYSIGFASGTLIVGNSQG